jgi:hypothetical protein
MRDRVTPGRPKSSHHRTIESPRSDRAIYGSLLPNEVTNGPGDRMEVGSGSVIYASIPLLFGSVTAEPGAGGSCG